MAVPALVAALSFQANAEPVKPLACTSPEQAEKDQAVLNQKIKNTLCCINPTPGCSGSVEIAALDCQKVDDRLLDLRASHEQFAKNYQETRCAAYALSGALAYSLYFWNTAQLRSISRSVLQEYESVRGSIRQVREESEREATSPGGAPGSKPLLDADAKASLDTLDRDLEAEHKRVQSLLTRRSVGLGVGLAAGAVGLGLLGGGVALIARDGDMVSPNGCTVDGRDLPCFAQTRDLGIGLSVVGGLVAVGSLVAAGVIVHSINKQKTPYRAAVPASDVRR